MRFSVTLRLQRLAGASRRRNTALRCCAASLRCGVALRCVVALGNGVALRTRVCCAAALRCCMAPLLRSWCCGVLCAAALGSVFLQPSCGGRASLRRCSKRRWVGADDLQDEGHHGERRVSRGPGANSAYLGDVVVKRTGWLGCAVCEPVFEPCEPSCLNKLVGRRFGPPVWRWFPNQPKPTPTNLFEQAGLGLVLNHGSSWFKQTGS